MVDVGDGYRALEAHEMIREGDGVGFPGGWVRAGCRVGHAADIGYPVRRRIRTESPGFRWLDEGERARKSDEHNLRHGDGWSSACEHAGDRIDGPMVFRRRIDAPLSDVGAAYRLLEEHEVMRESDEIEFPGGWVRKGHCYVEQPKSYVGYPMRRAVRIQIAGWRWLDVGETIREGDQRAASHTGQLFMAALPGRLADTPRAIRRRIDAPVSEPEPALVDCGCGHHQIDPRGDIYTQHQLWTRRRDIEQSDLSGEYCPVSELTHVPGIGISAERTIEILCPIDDGDFV